MADSALTQTARAGQRAIVESTKTKRSVGILILRVVGFILLYVSF